MDLVRFGASLMQFLTAKDRNLKSARAEESDAFIPLSS
jgi:hypothetical protein